MTIAETNTQETRFISRLASAGTDPKGRQRLTINIPAKEIIKIQDLAGKPVLITLKPIL